MGGGGDLGDTLVTLAPPSLDGHGARFPHAHLQPALVPLLLPAYSQLPAKHSQPETLTGGGRGGGGGGRVRRGLTPLMTWLDPTCVGARA
eukprot:418436-Rhodomonas_salina.1